MQVRPSQVQPDRNVPAPAPVPVVFQTVGPAVVVPEVLVPVALVPVEVIRAPIDA